MRLTYRQIQKFLNRSVIFFLALALFLFAFSILIGVYNSARYVTADDIAPLEKSLNEVEATLKEDVSSAGILTKFRENSERLKADLEIINNQTAPNDKFMQKAIDDLNDVALNLGTLQNQLSNERYMNDSAVSGLLIKLKALRERLATTSNFEKYGGVVLTQLGKLVVALAWPLLILFIFWFLFTSRKAPDRVAELFSNFKSVELFSAKFEIGEKIKASAEENFNKFRKQAKDQYDHWIQKKSLEEKLRALLLDKDNGVVKKINDIRLPLNPDKTFEEYKLKDYRCTIHVPDLLFTETFYQLLDYIPREQSATETRGRTWSYRFGFIGRVWRTENSDIQGAVSKNIDILIREWGMTRDEAENAGKGRQSFLGVLIEYKKVPVGLFYMDAKEENAFGVDSDKSLRTFIASRLEDLEITKDLAAINEELRGHAPLIRIYTQR